MTDKEMLIGIDVELRVAAMGLERVGETYVNWNGHPVIPPGRIA